LILRQLEGERNVANGEEEYMKEFEVNSVEKARMESALSNWFSRQQDVLFLAGPLRKRCLFRVGAKGECHCKIELSTPVKVWRSSASSSLGWESAFEGALEGLRVSDPWDFS